MRLRAPRSPLALALAGLVTPAAALAQSTIYELPGLIAGDDFGAAVWVAGDVDGDGVGDLLVGAPGTGGASGAGLARVISGVNGSSVRIMAGSTPGGRFGAALGAGDVTGDRRADPVVGAFRAGAGEQGTVTAFDGLSGAPLWALGGSAAGDHFGYAVACVGDVSGDGLDDVAIGAPDAFGGAGALRVVSGFDGATLYTLVGSVPDGRFGAALCALEDLDGDGRGELAVGAPRAISAASDQSGALHVLSGVDGANLWSLGGAGSNDAFGGALAATGDLDGDGVGDLIVGAPQPLGETGYARLVSVAAGSTLMDLFGAAPGDLFGAAVAPAGDVDGDGIEDFSVAAPLADEGGADAGRVELYSGESGALLASLLGSQADQRLGAALHGPFDVNQDGVVDLAVGSPGAAPSGNARVVSSADLALTADVHLLSVSGAGAQALTLDAGASSAGAQFVLLGSVSGSFPGTTFGGLHLPLNLDRYFDLTLKLNPNAALAPPAGVLDANGQASASFALPPSAPAGLLIGLTFHHAFLLHDGSGGGASVHFASNAVPLTLTL